MSSIKGDVMLGLLLACGIAPLSAQPATGTLDRTVLPVPEPRPPSITEQDARKAKAPPRFEVKVPAVAPNVVIVLIDDIGFGQPTRASTWGPTTRRQ